MTDSAARVLSRNRAIVLAYTAALVLFGITSVFSHGFASSSHIRVLLVEATFIGIVALGQTFVILGGGIDLSAPWTLTAAAMIVTEIAGGHDGPLGWGIPLVLALGAAIGLANGLGVTVLGVSPIIMTLAVNGIVEGGLLLHTHGAPPTGAPHLVVQLATGTLGPIPIALLIWIGIAAVATLILTWTAFGRQLYAVGTNMTVAEYSGVPTRRVVVSSYVVSGVAAAGAGILLAGFSGQAYLGMGDPYLFSSVAAVAIGGASILGGSGHYVGTIAGALILTVLAGLLPILNLDEAALQVIYGVVILVTLSLASGRLRLPRLLRRSA